MKKMIIAIASGAFLASFLIASDAQPEAVTAETNSTTSQDANKCGAGKCGTAKPPVTKKCASGKCGTGKCGEK